MNSDVTNLRTTLDAAWPDTDLSPFPKVRQEELVASWLRQCCDWVEAAQPRPMVLETALTGELRYRAERRTRLREEKQERKRELRLGRDKGKRWKDW